MNAPVSEAALAMVRRFASVDLPALARDLEQRIGGEVRFDNGGRAAGARDASNYGQAPMDANMKGACGLRDAGASASPLTPHPSLRCGRPRI